MWESEPVGAGVEVPDGQTHGLTAHTLGLEPRRPREHRSAAAFTVLALLLQTSSS